MGFENDLLISYAHLDDQALVEGQPGWITTLHRLLEIRVAQLSGEKPRIWRDPKLQGNDFFSDTIVAEQIPRTAALVTVLSPRYAQSEWCNREVDVFCRTAEQGPGLRVGTKARVFKVIKTPLPLERHPPELQPLLGYEFFTVDPQSGRPRELSQAYGPEAERQFLARLDDLAYDIAKLLEQLKESQGPAKAEAAPPKGTVYLAEASYDLREEREAIKRDLLRQGFEVLPDRPLPLVAGDLQAALEEDLRRCNLSVHLFGRGYGVVPDGETRSTLVLQLEAATRRTAPGFSRLLWLHPGPEVEDARQRAFLDHLRTDPAVHEGSELLEVTLEDLQARIYRKLLPPEPKKEKPAAAAPQPTAERPARVYLLCDQEDQDAVRPIEDRLFDQGMEAVLPLFAEDEAEARLDHEENLASCDAILVYYGAAGEPWLRRKLREIQKCAGQGRERPLLAQAIYLAPPSNPQKERFRTLEAIVLDGLRGSGAPEALEPLFAAIRQARAPSP